MVSLKNFITAFYPKSKYNLEANELLADLFLMTRNYEEAMTIIDNLPTKSEKLKDAYQKMAYYRGVENYNDYKFENAETFFDKSLKISEFKKYRSLVLFLESGYGVSKIRV